MLPRDWLRVKPIWCARRHLHATPDAATGAWDVMETQFLRGIAETSQRVMRADVVAIYQSDASNQIRLVDAVPSLEAVDELGLQLVSRLAESAARSQRTETDSCAAGKLIATASIRPGCRATVVVAALDLGQAAIEPFVLSQQLVTSAIATWHARCERAVWSGSFGDIGKLRRTGAVNRVVESGRP